MNVLSFRSMLAGLVEFDGFYLESDPCLVCNNPEVPFTVSIPKESIYYVCRGGYFT